MYEKFYNLTREPFHITPDPRFLFLSEGHKQALASMVYGIEKRKGFVAITGGIGVGKTTIIRAYLEKAAAANLKVIYIFQANIGFVDLVKTIYREFDLKLATNNLADMVNGLHLALIEVYRQGKTVVIIIDEAQNMPVETLENLRMLSNLETPTEKLIQVVLVGQAEFDDLLERHELRQLKQRIAIRTHILPLSAEDSFAYIQHRLSVAGLDNSSIFDKGALDVIVKEARGIPRKLNILCDNALITGYGYQKNPVTAGIAKEVVRDFAYEYHPRPVSRKWLKAALISLVIIIAIAVAFFLSPYGTLLKDGKKATIAIPATPDKKANESAPGSSPSPTVNPPLPATKPQVMSPAVVSPASGEQQGLASAPDVLQPRTSRGVYKTRVVKHGETLSDLVREVYGLGGKTALDPSLIEFVRRNNPSITDSDLIYAGSVIQFPDFPRKQR